MWDLGSPSKNWTCVPWIGRWILNHWTTREVPVCIFKKRWRGKHSVLLASQGVTISQHEFGRKEGICQIKVLFLFVLEKEMATHSSILSWRNPWMEEPGGLQSTGRKESDTTEWLHFTSKGTEIWGEANGFQERDLKPESTSSLQSPSSLSASSVLLLSLSFDYLHYSNQVDKYFL